ncbi:MAG TPA: circadian clock KaiB family protein [Gemmatimonadaceae bacterium]|nr:circadian clock KaiB family protein [Gemmatimonadaceae bacterium]
MIQLFVTGMSRASTEAVSLVRRICEERLAGRYELEVIDIYQARDRARESHIVAAPTLVRRWPLPVRRFVGNLSSRARVLRALDLEGWP